MSPFSHYFKDPVYLYFKNNLFNYILRKDAIAAACDYSGRLVLDVGSGISPVSPSVEKTVFSDISPEGVKFLKKEGKNAVVADITRLGFRKETFDIVLCSEALEHVEEDKKAIQEIVFVLKKGGTAIITVPTHKRLWGADDTMVKHFRRYDPDVFEKELRHAGFRNVERKKVGGPTERISTLATAMIFNLLSYRMVKRATEKIAGTKSPFTAIPPAYKAMNIAYAKLLKLDAALWPERFSSVMLFTCRK